MFFKLKLSIRHLLIIHLVSVKLFFSQIRKIENDETKTELYQSEAIREHSHPTWRPFNLHLRKIADNRNRFAYFL